MVDSEKATLLEWWYNKPRGWTGTWKEEPNGSIILNLFRKPKYEDDEDVQALLRRARGR